MCTALSCHTGLLGYCLSVTVYLGLSVIVTNLAWFLDKCESGQCEWNALCCQSCLGLVFQGLNGNVCRQMCAFSHRRLAQVLMGWSIYIGKYNLMSNVILCQRLLPTNVLFASAETTQKRCVNGLFLLLVRLTCLCDVLSM